MIMLDQRGVAGGAFTGGVLEEPVLTPPDPEGFELVELLFVELAPDELAGFVLLAPVDELASFPVGLT